MLAELDGFERRHGVTVDRSRFHRHLAHLCLRSGRRMEAASHFLRAFMRFRDGYSRIDIATDRTISRGARGGGHFAAEPVDHDPNGRHGVFKPPAGAIPTRPGRPRRKLGWTTYRADYRACPLVSAVRLESQDMS